MFQKNPWRFKSSIIFALLCVDLQEKKFSSFVQLAFDVKYVFK